MPPCRTTLEMRSASIPDSLATMASASSEAWRCWVSKSAGTYSASITGVIRSTLRRRTAPFQVCDSVAAVAIAGFARSVSARSIGTRMDRNICASVSPDHDPINQIMISSLCLSMIFSENRFPLFRIMLQLNAADGFASVSLLRQSVQSVLQHLRTDKHHQPPVTECHIGPVVDRKVEYRKTRCRQIVGERLAPRGVAAAGQRERQFVHSGIVPDHHQAPRITGGRGTDGVQELRRIGAIKF